jgi:hypothetical protein
MIMFCQPCLKAEVAPISNHCLKDEQLMPCHPGISRPILEAQHIYVAPMQKQQALLGEMMREGYGCDRDPAGDQHKTTKYRRYSGSHIDIARTKEELLAWPQLRDV